MEQESEQVASSSQTDLPMAKRWNVVGFWNVGGKGQKLLDLGNGNLSGIACCMVSSSEVDIHVDHLDSSKII